MKGLILAAGMGMRLRPLTAIRPKPAIPFLNYPFIGHTLELLGRADVNDIAVNLHHLPHVIKETMVTIRKQWSNQDPPRIVFSQEDTILGTAGAISKLRDFLAGDTFVVCNGKIYFEEDLRHAIDFHHRSGALVTMVLVPHSTPSPYGPVMMDGQDNVTGFGRENSGTGRLPYVFTGVHILGPRALDYVLSGPSDTVKDVYPRMMERGETLKGFVSSAYWCECSTPRRYLSKSLEVLGRKGLENLVADGSQLRPAGLIAGSSVQIESNSEVDNCILWDDVTIGPDSSLSNVIITSGVELSPGTRLRDAIITPPLEYSDNKKAVHYGGNGDYLVWPL